MSRIRSNTDDDDAPHTLRSDLHSPAISMLRPSHHSLSLKSNNFEISQSPTRLCIQESLKSQCSNLATQTSAALEISTDPCSTHQTEVQQFSCHSSLSNEKNEEAVSENKSTDRETCVHNSETFPGPPHPNLPETLPDFSPESNSLSEPTSQLVSNLVPGQNMLSSSDISPSVYFPSSVQFFSFVILNSPEDQDIASRVCNELEQLGIGKGTTFCEGFETPGTSPLTCLENALENSAYIILLLTNDFLKAEWGDFQCTIAMMNSIENAVKLGSVIPYYIKDKKPNGKIPVWIKCLIALDENSPVFKTRALNTFKRDKIINRYESWRKKTNLPYLQQQNITLQWSTSDPNAVLPQQTEPPFPSYHGQTPIIQISNARNVQIGNQNSMNVQFLPTMEEEDSDANINQDAE